MQQKRFLICRPDRIGDVVLSTPIPREIKKQFPDSYVALLLRNYTKDIYLNNPYVDKIITMEELTEKCQGDFWNEVKEIKKYRFNHAFMLLPNERINYLLFFAGIKYRVGVGHKFFQFITFVKSVSRKKYNPLKSEADYCMDLARRAGVENGNLDSEIFLDKSEKEKVKRQREDLLSEKKYLIGVHSTSGNSAPNWTPETYRKLIDELIKRDDIKVVVTDNKIPEELKNIPDLDYPNLNLSLRDSIINFAALDYLISASTGPMHIAAALKTKTISMFCPLTACSPKLWGPMGNESKIILPEENYCQNKCPGDPKICTFEGEGGINTAKVLEELEKLI